MARGIDLNQSRPPASLSAGCLTWVKALREHARFTEPEAEDEMRSRGIIALAISGTAVTAYHLLQQQPPPPELGIAPEMFDWAPVSARWVLGFISSTLILALGIWLAINFARWLIGLRDLS